MDTVTPLKVSLVTNFDPILIFGLSPFGVVGKLGQGLGVTGAAVATAPGLAVLGMEAGGGALAIVSVVVFVI